MASTLLIRNLGRQTLAVKNSVLTKSCVPIGNLSAYKQMEDFWAKNRKLNRPLSPHLSIYKPQLTSMLSLCHRVTGIAMAVTVSGTSILLFALPGDFATYLNLLKDMSLGPIIITGLKYILAFPVSYHYVNGIRHLAWDWAYGFGLERLYKTGYFALSLAFLVASTFVFLF